MHLAACLNVIPATREKERAAVSFLNLGFENQAGDAVENFLPMQVTVFELIVSRRVHVTSN